MDIKNNEYIRLSRNDFQTKIEKRILNRPITRTPSSLRAEIAAAIKLRISDCYADIITNFSYNPDTPNDICYSFSHIEYIFLLDMFYFEKSGHYARKCPYPKCNKIFENNRTDKFYCSKECKTKHRNVIYDSCAPWKKYEKIRKKISARHKSGIYTLNTYYDILNCLTDIRDNYIESNNSEDSHSEDSHSEDSHSKKRLSEEEALQLLDAKDKEIEADYIALRNDRRAFNGIEIK